MGLMQKLCETYDTVIECEQSSESRPLIPIGFTEKKVSYEVVIDQSGRFVSAASLDDKSLVIPSTPEAESRTSTNRVPFPLVEQLKYFVVADGDSKCLDNYLNQLDTWIQEPEAPAYLKAVLDYLKQKTILADMERFLPKLKYPRDGGGMVSFNVQGVGELCAQPALRRSWSEHISRTQSGTLELCYVEGRKLPSCPKHPKVQGNAKLISSKDSAYPFQYKGRFAADGSAATVSYDASAKLHNTLDWLVNRQGMRRYGMTWVTWNTNGAPMSVILAKNVLMPGDDDGAEEDDEDAKEARGRKPCIDTFEGYAVAVRNAALGFGNEIEKYNRERAGEAVTVGMTAATDGRMSVVYYQEIPGNKYIDNLESWYKSCCWWIYDFNDKAMQIGTPRIKELARAILGSTTVDEADRDSKNTKSASKVMRETHVRFMSCIMDKCLVPLNMIQSAYIRSCNPLTFTTGKNNKWSRSQWNACLNAACALIHKSQYDKREQGENVFGPELAETSHDRSYLYGRLLAVADAVEAEVGYRRGDDSGQTNAIKLFSLFAQRPFDSWQHLHYKLVPYFEKLDDGNESRRASCYQNLLGDIESLFEPGERSLTMPLDWPFIQGYSSQRMKLYGHRAKGAHADEVQEHIVRLPESRSELYGCLIAIADAVEVLVTAKKSTDISNAGRTNAIHLMQTFEARPCETWPKLHDRLIPYMEELEKRGVDERKQSNAYKALIAQVEKQFTWADRASAEPLDGSYLHGYYTMRNTLLSGKWNMVEDESTQAAEPLCRESLFGMLLGIADREEFMGQKHASTEDRPTNALRLLAAMRQQPSSVWRYLKKKLEPYQKRRKEVIGDELIRISEIERQLEDNNWMTDEQLKGIYMHSYYMERKINEQGEKYNGSFES